MKTWQLPTIALLSVLSLPSAAFAAPVPAPFTLDADAGGVLTSTGDGTFSLSNATAAAPVSACFSPMKLSRNGDAIVLTATMSRSVEAGHVQFRMGLFDSRDGSGNAGYLGYFVGNSANNSSTVLFRRNGVGTTPYWSGVSGGSYLTGSPVSTPSTMPPGDYALALTITRVSATAVRLDYSMIRSDGGYSTTGSFDDLAPQQLAEDDLAYDCVGFFLHGKAFTGTIALDAIDAQLVHAPGQILVAPRPVLASLSAMTFNIRYAGNEPSNYSWSQRRPRVARIITDATPDIVGVQEALGGQVSQMRSDLPAYGFYGVGRDNGASSGEHAGIFFLASRFTLVDSGSFWLSETPSVPGTTFSTMSGATPRIASWVVLEDAVTELRYFVLNTHWDNQDQSARDRSATLIRERIAELADGLPVLLLGDFNTTETSAAAVTLIGTNVSGGNRLIDAFRRVTPTIGSQERTFQGFTTETNGARVDFVLHSPELQAKSATIVRDTVDGYLPSDHYPVMASFHVAIPPEYEVAPDPDPDPGTDDADAGMGDPDPSPGHADGGDAGPTDTMGGTGGCSVSPVATPEPWPLGVLLAVAALAARRRHRRRKPRDGAIGRRVALDPPSKGGGEAREGSP